MWFNEDEDFDEGEAVVPGAAADLVPQTTAKKLSPQNSPSNSPIPSETKNQQQQQTVLNNNTANNNTAVQQVQVNNSTSSTMELPISTDMSPSTTVSAIDKSGSNIFKKVSYIFFKFFY